MEGLAMASAAGDIRCQLAALLGKPEVGEIRKTNETPPRISVIDVIMVVLGKDRNHAAEDYRRMIQAYPDVNADCVNFSYKAKCIMPPSSRRKGSCACDMDPEGVVVCLQHIAFECFALGIRFEITEVRVRKRGFWAMSKGG